MASTRARWVGVALIVVAAWLVWDRTDDLGAAFAELDPARLVGAFVLGTLGTVLLERTWLAMVRGLGARPAPREAADVFYVSQLGKYLPGSVWPVLAQMQFGLRWGIARTVMFGANVLFLGVITATGILTGALLLPWSSAIRDAGLDHYWWLLLVLVPVLVGLHPRTLPALLDGALRRTGREPLGLTLSARALAAAVGWAVLAWAAMGAQVALLATAYGDLGGGLVVAAVGGMALGWAAGIAVIPAPAGAGIRDTIVALTLSPFIGTTPAVGVALASRGLLLLTDVALGALGALRRWRRSAAPQLATEEKKSRSA